MFPRVRSLATSFKNASTGIKRAAISLTQATRAQKVQKIKEHFAQVQENERAENAKKAELLKQAKDKAEDEQRSIELSTQEAEDRAIKERTTQLQAKLNQFKPEAPPPITPGSTKRDIEEAPDIDSVKYNIYHLVKEHLDPTYRQPNTWDNLKHHGGQLIHYIKTYYNLRPPMPSEIGENISTFNNMDPNHPYIYHGIKRFYTEYDLRHMVDQFHRDLENIVLKSGGQKTKKRMRRRKTRKQTRNRFKI